MTVATAAGEHQRRVNTKHTAISSLELDFKLEHMGQEKIGVGKGKGAVFRNLYTVNQFNQMKTPLKNGGIDPGETLLQKLSTHTKRHIGAKVVKVAKIASFGGLGT